MGMCPCRAPIVSTYILPAGVENLTLTGAAHSVGGGNNGNNVLAGNIGNNVLMGVGGNDTIYGGLGDDRLVGELGKDLMTGVGLDRMVVNGLSESGLRFVERHVINTFAHGDKIDLAAIDANSGTSGNQAFTFDELHRSRRPTPMGPD